MIPIHSLLKKHSGYFALSYLCGMLPINRYNKVAVNPMNEVQKQALKEFQSKVEKGVYTFIDNPCLCGNNTYQENMVVTEQDRYGIEMKNVICDVCGLIRPVTFLDTKSVIEFYINEYRRLYSGGLEPSPAFFKVQNKLGKEYLQLLRTHTNVKTSDKFVFEVGCGAGGIILPFLEEGFKVMGCDFDTRYLEYGKSKGLDLKYGEFYEHIKDNEADIVVLSLVFEHFTEPLKELSNILKIIKPGGHLIFAVPGIYDMHKDYVNPVLFFQNAHLFSFYKKYLEVMFNTFGMEVKYGDEWCKFIVQKPMDWQPKEVTRIYDDSLKGEGEKIRKYVSNTNSGYIYKTSYYYWKREFEKIVWKIKGIK